MFFPALAHDLRIALRGWLRDPGFAATSILTLALGIGASTALFTVVHGVLVQPLPYRDADRLVVVRAEQDFEGASRPVRTSFSNDAVAAWPREPAAFARLAFYSDGAGALNLAAGSEVVTTAAVEGPFFETVDGPMLLGRAVGPGDGARPVAVISERLWQRHHAASADALGQAMTVNGQALTIVGVARADFQVPARTVDVWLPAAAVRLVNPRCCNFTPIGRLTDGTSIQRATEDVSATVQALATQLPRQLSNTRVQVVPLRDTVVAGVRPVLLVLSAAVALLLVLAVGNVVSLLLARQTARLHDVGIRRALGASPWRVLREGIAESAWLCAAGGAAGVVAAWGGVRLLQAIGADVLPRIDAVGVDWRALTFSLVAVTAVTLVVGTVPAVSSRGALARLGGRERGATASPRARRALGVLSAAQLAISVLLLVAASLLGRSLVALMQTDLGVVADKVATASINLAMGRTLSEAQQADLVARIVERVSASPGVIAAGVGTSRPPDVSRVRLTLSRNNEPGSRASYQAAWVPVTPGYFAALGIQLQRGRLFTDADHAEAPPAVILSTGTARRLFPDQDAIGQRIGLPALRNGKTVSMEMPIVGVVADVKFSGLDQPADDVVYRPFAQQPWIAAFLVVRTAGDPDLAASQLAREVALVDPAVAVSDARSMDAVLSSVTAQPRLRGLVLAAIAVVALVIAGVGLHGVVAYSVSQRRAELGVRMALGADAPRIRRMVVGEGLVLAVTGSGLGLIGAMAATRVLSTLLYGVAPSDPVSYVAAAAAALTAGFAGSYLPARRASRTDPAVVLRAE